MAQALDILYSFRRCPYAMRARLALLVAERPCELREVVLRDKPRDLLAISPKATVPVMQCTDGTILEESLDIMRFCLSANDPQKWLRPQTGRLDEMLALIARNDSDFKHHLDRYKYASRHEPDAAQDHRQAGMVFLLELEARLAHTRFLFGERMALADAAIAPFVRQFASTDRDWFEAQGWPALRSWLDDFLQSPLLARAMHKYPQWQPGDEPTLFPNRGVTLYTSS